MNNIPDFPMINNGSYKNQTKLNNSVGFLKIQIVIVVAVFSITISLVISLPSNIAYGQQQQQRPSSSTSNSGKAVILTFGDTLKGQITTAKPILYKYGFKASFFITCDWVGAQKSKSPRLSWQDISSLQKDGQDIESKTMTHRDLSKLSAADLNFEVAQSKKCLSDHGINSTIFTTPHGDEWNNAPLMFYVVTATRINLARLIVEPILITVH